MPPLSQFLMPDIRKRQRTDSSTDEPMGGGHQKQENEEAPGTEDPPKDVSWIKKRRTGSGTSVFELICGPGDLSSPQQEQENEETPGSPMDVSASPDPAAHTEEKEEIVITSIRATNLALGLRRISAGFHAVVHHTDLEYKTEDKPVSANNDVVEWRGPIPIPSDLTATVSLAIHASFEFQPVLGHGEQLRKLTVTVNELLDRSGKDTPFNFFAKAGDVVSPCSSLLVTVTRQKCESNSCSVSRSLEPHSLGMGSGGQLENVTNQGHSALSRYRKYGERSDLECATERFQHALDICPLNHPCRAAAESNMATAKIIHCRVYDTNASFDIPLMLYRNALSARPVGHPDRPSTLTQLAAVHLARFEKRRYEVDTTQAEALLDEAMELSSSESHEQRVAIFMLQLHVGQAGGQPSVDLYPALPLTDVDPSAFSVQLLRRFDQHGNLADLQQAISILEGSIMSISPWSGQYVAGLTNLGTALYYRFNHLGNLIDLEEAISRQQEAAGLTPNAHPHKLACLNNLGNSSFSRFRRLGEISDLEQAISRQQEAVDLAPNNHPDKPTCLNNLGNSFVIRFERLGEIRDIEEAISRQQEAVNLTPNGHPAKPNRLSSLGNSFAIRFERLGKISDIEEAISRQQDAVNLTPNGHSERPGSLNNLGNSLQTRFEHLGEISDLEKAVSMYQSAVDLTPNDHPDKPGRVSNLGNSLATHFKRLGEISDLEKAISRQLDAVDLTPNGHPAKPGRLNNLGNSFLTPISRQQDAVDLTPNDHPDKPAHLSNLGNSFVIRFQRLGEIKDIHEAILRQQDAVDFLPNGHPDKPGRLSSLGNSFALRFERLGEISDIEEAILRHRDAVALTPNGHPEKPGRLSNLGNSYRICFQRLGEISDLEKAVSRHQSAVDFTPNGHPDKPARLSNLGTSFLIRFLQLGEISDLTEAISRQQDAVDLTPNGHPDKPAHLSNLGSSFSTRFERLGEIRDIEEAISRQRDAVDLTTNDHPDKPAYLSNLGHTFFNRFQRLGEISDLEEAISRQQAAVDFIPNGHPRKPICLSKLGIFFTARFQRLGGINDIEEAIARQQDAVDLTPDGHPEKTGYLGNLGDSFVIRFQRFGEIASLEQAILSLSLAACAPAGTVAVRFHASQRWIRWARFLHHQSLLQAYSVAINLLPQLAWIGLTLAHRFRELVQAADVVRDAAAAALGSGRPETAVEWLEQGRSVVWGELLQLRSSYDELASAHPDHARRLRALSSALEHAGAARDKFISNRSDHPIKSLQQQADQHRRLAIGRDTLLQDIRRLPGFERLLLHKEFSELRASAHSGPVVILNAADTRCDALIVLANVDHVIHVPLPNFSLDRSKQLETSLKKYVRDAREGRYGYPVEEADARATQWKLLLSFLWKCVVKPVLDALAFSIPGDLSRVFWCPTGPLTFLPIHAAGLYDDTRNSELGHKVFDFVISSYTPTLGTLAASSRSNITSNSDLRLLAVRQPPSDGQTTLPGVVAELEHIKAVIRNSLSARVTLSESSVGSVEEVLTLMKKADWVHFACHGVQDDSNPTNSGLCLANERRLRISDIVSLSRPRGGLAFLSACQTAKGNAVLSDEAIHIAAGMLFAGYGGVVGTMWSINDRLAPDVAKDVYEQLFHENGTGIPDYREAAKALHVAVGRLRAREKVLFEHWLPFIHVGL